MNSVPEPAECLKSISISTLVAGDILVNLGNVLEISEEAEAYCLVIERMQERQVWRFRKDEELFIKLGGAC